VGSVTTGIRSVASEPGSATGGMGSVGGSDDGPGLGGLSMIGPRTLSCQGLYADVVPRLVVARIFSTADAFEAMAELRQHSGTQFDPQVVAIFDEMAVDMHARRQQE